jgi:hypothetical protein
MFRSAHELPNALHVLSMKCTIIISLLKTAKKLLLFTIKYSYKVFYSRQLNL